MWETDARARTLWPWWSEIVEKPSSPSLRS